MTALRTDPAPLWRLTCRHATVIHLLRMDRAYVVVY